MVIIPKNVSHYIYDDGHLTHFTSCLKVWRGGCDKFMYGNFRGLNT